MGTRGPVSLHALFDLSREYEEYADVMVVRLFVNPVCNGFAQGNYIDVAPGQTGCFAGRITSYSFL
jgi:hypothetical protein